MNKDIGNRIKKIRNSKGLDSKSVADEVGILDTSLSKIEREGTNSVDTLLRIAKALEVSPCEFFGEKATNMVNDPKSNYGFATKADFSELAQAILKLIKTVERIEEQLPKKKSTSEKHKQPPKKV